MISKYKHTFLTSSEVKDLVINISTSYCEYGGTNNFTWTAKGDNYNGVTTITGVTGGILSINASSIEGCISTWTVVCNEDPSYYLEIDFVIDGCETPEEEYVEEAPNDGVLYARKYKEWVAIKENESYVLPFDEITNLAVSVSTGELNNPDAVIFSKVLNRFLGVNKNTMPFKYYTKWDDGDGKYKTGNDYQYRLIINKDRLFALSSEGIYISTDGFSLTKVQGGGGSSEGLVTFDIDDAPRLDSFTNPIIVIKDGSSFATIINCSENSFLGAMYKYGDSWRTINIERGVDGFNTWREMLSWANDNSNTMVDEAPEDGELYARVSKGWEKITLYEDSPNDGNTYARNSGSWVQIQNAILPFDGITDEEITVEHVGTTDIDKVLFSTSLGIFVGKNGGVLTPSKYYIAWYDSKGKYFSSNDYNKSSEIRKDKLFSNESEGEECIYISTDGSTLTKVQGGGVSENILNVNASDAIKSDTLNYPILIINVGTSYATIFNISYGNVLGAIFQNSGNWSIIRKPSLIQDFNTYGDLLDFADSNGLQLVEDAPTDGGLYARKWQQWKEIPISSDAPDDGEPYARSGLDWKKIPQFKDTVEGSIGFKNSYIVSNGLTLHPQTNIEQVLGINNYTTKDYVDEEIAEVRRLIENLQQMIENHINDNA